MKKLVAIAVAAVVALGVTAAPASAETLYRNGSNKVTIKPVGAPEGSSVIKAKVTVKKGKKTVARNKNFYKAKKGSYKVTSTVSYYFPAYNVQGPAKQVQGPSTQVQGPSTTKNVPADDLYLGTCTVTSRTIVQDNTTYKYLGDPDAWLSGDAWIDYTANCPATYYDDDFNKQNVNVNVKWQESDYVFVENVTGDKTTDLAANPDFYYVGQFTDYVYNFTLLNPVTYVAPGSWTTVPGAWTTVPGDWTTVPATGVTTVKTTRYVRVR
jgi:hypothetical protein